ncbi:TPA: helix-turn-helix transcriptional regulator [Streptococcus pyogenes]|uniref:helix-turn-helix domain-containing protein n=1 Tax=Streptococcus dysgalactiae TaxID=1334 RepID=UPI0003B0F4D4|nr:S24 family peptidase [Streptococcus dysgalactiae]QBX14278.1 repressor [Streptococcus phage Javan133]QBX23323.1 repressor [Streptococcus phage Javan126]QBX23819.1 repressor [Streptococcus phage Javan164]BAN93734.1 cI repressor [Streptococcus dysgalactiae subsp. equisimilis 167]HER0002289.1 helix-turn-helix transcriptional regulator [Streptococcus pyogenes]
MNILGNSIKTIRKSKKLTQKDLAKLTGFKQNTISNHENGKRQLDELDIRKYAEALNVAPQDLFDSSKSTPSIPFPNFDPRKAILLSNYSKLNDNRKNRLVSTSETLLAEEKGEITNISEKRSEYGARKRISLSVPGKVSAGTGYWQEDDYDTEVDFYADEIPDEKDYDTVAVVVGHSMEPKIKNGDFLFIKLTDQVDINKIGIFQVNGENYVKKLKNDHLQSLNPKYADITLSESDNFRTVGEVVDIYREG